MEGLINRRKRLSCVFKFLRHGLDGALNSYTVVEIRLLVTSKGSYIISRRCGENAKKNNAIKVFIRPNVFIGFDISITSKNVFKPPTK